ncbi:hypothetical protein IC235_08545 [Hymenobacter sp. BT664]|uniref:CdiI immunity protein domain-containing protein n=1 Tax=Hymenobacter montanus TaxID=2771359 RepID=A0A927BCH5_9BACT|nr:hypothetical protein [Hymenobacter montanus]MBD2767941.1 hypothetical protein [Hymenobacter montanus]
METYSYLQKIIWQEFSSQYLPDELPLKWEQAFIDQELPDIARRSALRLRHGLKNDHVRELSELLETSSRDPNHSLIQTICDATLIDWADESENWIVLQKVLNLIALNLKQ